MDESIELAKFLMDTRSAPPVTSPVKAMPQPEPSSAVAENLTSRQSTPSMTFDEAPGTHPPATSGDPLQQVHAEIVVIKQFLGKIWQKIKDI